MDGATNTPAEPTLEQLEAMADAEFAQTGDLASDAVAGTAPGDALGEETGGDAADPHGQTSPDTRSDEVPEAVRKKAQTEPEAETKPPAEDKRSKFAKETERFDRNWKKFQEEKAAKEKEFSEREARVAAREKKFQAERAQTLEGDAKALEADAAHWEADGRKALAEQARAEAARLREQAKAMPVDDEPTATEAQAKGEAFKLTQDAAWQQVAKDYPSFVDDAKPEFKQFTDFLRANPAVKDVPAGPLYAARFLAEKMKADRVPGLEKTVGELQTEIKRLKGQLTLGGGEARAGIPTGARRPQELSDEELEREAEREVRAGQF